MARTSACASASDVDGANRWLTFTTKRSGTTLRPRPPSFAWVAVVTVRYVSPSMTDSRGSRRASSERKAAPFVSALSASQGRALCPVRPSNVRVA